MKREEREEKEEDLRRSSSILSETDAHTAVTPQVGGVEFEELYYYGVIMMAHTVVTIFKNN